MLIVLGRLLIVTAKLWLLENALYPVTYSNIVRDLRDADSSCNLLPQRNIIKPASKYCLLLMMQLQHMTLLRNSNLEYFYVFLGID